MSKRHASYHSWRPICLLFEALGSAKVGDSLIREYLSFAGHLISNHGLATATKVLKDLDSRVKLVVIGQRVPRAPFGKVWLKTNSNGIPSKLKILQENLKTNGMMCVCTTSLVRLIMVSPDHDISTITSAGTMAWPPNWIPGYTDFVQRILQPVQIELDPWHTSTKAGPNGPAAIISSGIDALALAEHQDIQSLFEEGCRNTGATELLERYHNFLQLALKSDMTCIRKPKVLTLAKLAYLSDKAGKTRVVYIMNYWWQDLLKPLHTAIFKWLKQQPQDGTFDQKRAVATVKGWTGKGLRLWSYDLTAATDRWPKAHQAIGIRAIAGPVWEKVWLDAMGISPWSEPHKMWVHYAVGQPMGAYGSWAALALNHHLLARWCASRAGVSWDCYVVLGDDIVISNELVAYYYKQALTDLGVTISEAKSVTAEMQITGSSAEFAKQLLLDGRDLTPLSPGLLKEVYDDHQWWKVLELLQEVQAKWGPVGYILPNRDLWFPPLTMTLLAPLKRYQSAIVKIISDPEAPRCLLTEVKEDLGYLEVLYMMTVEGTCTAAVPFSGKYLHNPWAGITRLTYLTMKSEMLTDKLSRETQELIALRNSLKEGSSGNKLPGWFLENPFHPIYSVIDRLEGALYEKVRQLAFGDHSLTGEIVTLKMDAEFLKDLLLNGVSYTQWKDQKSKRLKIGCQLSIELLRKIRDLEKEVLSIDWLED